MVEGFGRMPHCNTEESPDIGIHVLTTRDPNVALLPALATLMRVLNSEHRERGSRTQSLMVLMKSVAVGDSGSNCPDQSCTNVPFELSP